VEEGTVKAQMAAFFIADGVKGKQQPENFKGVEGYVEASCQLKKRSSNSGLDDLEIQLCEKHGIPTVEEVDRHECFVFNPAHADWLTKHGPAVSAALIKLGAPADIIQKQDEKKKVCVADDAIDVLFKKPKAVVDQMLPVVSDLAIRPKVPAENLEEAFDLVVKVLKAKAKEASESDDD
jgi:hypothetical protein